MGSSIGWGHPSHVTLCRYYAAAAFSDSLLGELLAQVDALGRREDTAVVLTADRAFLDAPHSMLVVVGSGRLLVLEYWVGARRPFHLSLFLTAPRVVLPKMLVLLTPPLSLRLRLRLPRGGCCTRGTARC